MLAGLWQSLNRFILVGSCLIPRHHPTTMPFGRVVSLGDRVRAVATTVRGDAWAKHHFPRDWKSHEVMGVVTGKEGRSVLVRWDDDRQMMRLRRRPETTRSDPTASSGPPSPAASQQSGMQKFLPVVPP